MQTNLKRFIYAVVMSVIFLALASFLLAEEPELKIKNLKVEEDVQVTLTGIIDDAKLEFKVEESICENQKVTDYSGEGIMYKLIFPDKLKNEKVNLRIFYDKKLIGSVFVLVPDEKKHLVITYDCMDLKNPLRDNKNEQYVVSYRKHVTFRAINANPLRYIVILSGQNKNYFTESPKVYQDIVKEAMDMKVSEPVQVPKSDKTNLDTVAGGLSSEANKEVSKNEEKLLTEKSEMEKLEIKLKGEKEKRSMALQEYEKAQSEENKALEEKNTAVIEFTKAQKEYDNAYSDWDAAKKASEEAQKKVEGIQNEINKENDKGKIEILNGDLKSAENIVIERGKELEEKAKIKAEKDTVLKAADQKMKIYSVEYMQTFTDKKTITKGKYDTQLKNTETLEEQFEDSKKEYEKHKKEVDEKVEKLKSLEVFLNAYDKLSIIEEFYNQLVTVSFGYDSFERIQKNIEPILGKLLTENSEIEKKKSTFEFNLNCTIPLFSKWLKDAQAAYSKIDIDWFKDDENKAKTKFSPRDFTIIALFKEKVDKLVTMDIIGKIQTLISIIKPENFVQSITTPTVDSDEVHFTARIEAMPNLVNTEAVSKIIGPIVVKVKSGWAINFSTGVVFHYRAHDRSYRLERASNQGSDTNYTTYTIVENENKKSIIPSVAGLMHIYPRSIRSVKWGGIVFGIGTKDTEKFHYYIGTSCMFGSPRRFVVNAGIVLTKIDFLKPEYKKGGSIVLANAIDSKSQLLVEKQFKARLFFGFTYNLTSE